MAKHRAKSRDAVLLQLTPAPLRRAAVCGGPLALTLWGVWVAAAAVPDGAPLRIALGLAVVVAAAVAVALWRATDVTMTLTEAALSDSRGRILARIDQVERVERGALSLAPTGGFILRLSAAAPAAWVPGVWWRVGRRVGVGGTTPRRMTREMALLVEAMLALRRP